MGKSDKPELHKSASLLLKVIILLNVVFAIVYFYLASQIDSLLKLLSAIDEVEKVRSTLVAIMVIVGILSIIKIIGSILVLLRKKIGFWILCGAVVGTLIMLIVLGAKAGSMGSIVLPLIMQILIYGGLFCTLLMRVNGESGWKQLK